jgi:hypothetical protein
VAEAFEFALDLDSVSADFALGILNFVGKLVSENRELGRDQERQVSGKWWSRAEFVVEDGCCGKCARRM